jgi:hypothetical protein
VLPSASCLDRDFGEVNAMKTLVLLAAFCGVTAVSVGAEPPTADDPWLSRLIGH